MGDSEAKSRSILNPNYASVRCIQPMPGMIKIRNGRSNHENVVPIHGDFESANENGEPRRAKRFIVADGNPQHPVGNPQHPVGKPQHHGEIPLNHEEFPQYHGHGGNSQDFQGDSRYDKGNPRHHEGNSQYDYAADFEHKNHNYYEPAHENDDSNHNVRLVNSFSYHNHNGMYENVEINSNQNANTKTGKELPDDSANLQTDDKAEKLLPNNKEKKEADGRNGEQKEKRPLTWREHMRNFLHSKPCHIAVIVLVLIDSVLVITEILLDLELIELHEESPAPEIVHYCSISILSIFMLEIAAKMIADWHHFRTHKIEVLDAIVVVVAFGCDIGMLFIENEALVAVGLLVLLRLWRVVRLVNGIILTVKNEADDRVHAIKAKLKEAEDELEESKQKVEKQEQEIKKLREILTQNGIHFDEEQLESQDGDEGPRNGAILKLNDSDNIISIDT